MEEHRQSSSSKKSRSEKKKVAKSLKRDDVSRSKSRGRKPKNRTSSSVQQERRTPPSSSRPSTSSASAAPSPGVSSGSIVSPSTKSTPSSASVTTSTQIAKAVEDVEPICVSRFKLEKFVHLPFFKRLAIGCFVRICVETSEGSSVYKAARVIDVVELPKVYAVGKARTKSAFTVRFGKEERIFPLTVTSNSVITAKEFEEWRENAMADDIPDLELVDSKADELKKAMTYEFTADDVDKMQHTNRLLTKAKIYYHREDRDSRIARLLKKAEVTTEKRAEELEKKRSSSSSSFASKINDRNRKADIKKAELLMKEKRMVEAKRKAATSHEDNANIKKTVKKESDSLFDLHNFDIEIEVRTSPTPLFSSIPEKE